jgi:hypothetical protein
MSAGSESWFERVIREATDAGEFDALPGSGRPIDDLDRPYDPAWWARAWVERETVAESARDLSARIRRQLPGILAGVDEPAMATSLRALNAEIDALNARLAEVDRLPRLDAAALIANRRSRRMDS